MIAKVRKSDSISRARARTIFQDQEQVQFQFQILTQRGKVCKGLHELK